MKLSKILPNWCYLCHATFDYQSNIGICPQCIQLLPWWNNEICANCNEPKIYCHACKNQPKITSIFIYQPPISNLIISMKYNKNFYAARLLKKMIKNWLQVYTSFLEDYDVIVPIPMHWRRFFVRNFNPAKYLIKFDTPRILVKRLLHTPAQTLLNPSQRKKLLKKKVFQVTKNNLQGKKVLIFDDVITTKSTVLNLAAEIKKTKPAKIGILCLARSVFDKQLAKK